MKSGKLDEVDLQKAKSPIFPDNLRVIVCNSMPSILHHLFGLQQRAENLIEVLFCAIHTVFIATYSPSLFFLM